MSMAAIFLMLFGIYLACGLVFAMAFVFAGVKRMDPHAVSGSRGFRGIIVPGVMLLWPLLLKRWAGGATHPPEERSAHRSAGRAASPRPKPHHPTR